MRSGFYALIVMLLFTIPVQATDLPEQHLSLKNHLFIPQELTLPAGQKVKLLIKNEDATPVEFESFELNREKIIPANSEITVFIEALDPGIYPFFDDFHHDTTTGKIIVK